MRKVQPGETKCLAPDTNVGKKWNQEGGGFSSAAKPVLQAQGCKFDPQCEKITK